MMAKDDPAPTMGSSKWLCGPGWQPAELPAIGQSDETIPRSIKGCSSATEEMA